MFQGVVLVGHMGTFIFTFIFSSILICRLHYQFAIPLTENEGSSLLKPHLQLLSIILLILAILIKMRWNLKIVLISSSLIANQEWWTIFDVLLNHFYFFCFDAILFPQFFVVWVLCVFRILIFCQKYIWQWFSPIL